MLLRLPLQFHLSLLYYVNSFISTLDVSFAKKGNDCFFGNKKQTTDLENKSLWAFSTLHTIYIIDVNVLRSNIVNEKFQIYSCGALR